MRKTRTTSLNARAVVARRCAEGGLGLSRIGSKASDPLPSNYDFFRRSEQEWNNKYKPYR